MDVFKTPGKLRGKTPWTVRKQNLSAPRQPLSDIFAPNVPAPPSAHRTNLFDKVAQFQIAEDKENQPSDLRPHSRGKSPQRLGRPGNTDSGYHGMMTEDEMEAENQTDVATDVRQHSVDLAASQPESGVLAPQEAHLVIEAGETSGGSFLSAREDGMTSDVAGQQAQQEVPEASTRSEVNEMLAQSAIPHEAIGPVPDVEAEAEPVDLGADLDEETTHSTSDTSSPGKPLQRKSSFTFTALPAREPLTAKRSIGGRNSQIDTQTGRNSVLATSFRNKSLGLLSKDDEEQVQETSQESKAYNKISTQLLHDRITLLGQSKPSRPSSSLPQTANVQSEYPQLPSTEQITTKRDDIESEDDWIAPAKPQMELASEQNARQQTVLAPGHRPALHKKSLSATHVPSPSRVDADTEMKLQKSNSVSHPSLVLAKGITQSTTPAGSQQTKKHHDGPLSASKSRLYSVLKSAKNIFASSASASAAAKLEVHNASPVQSLRRNISDESKTAAVFNMPGALYSDRDLPLSPSRPVSVLSTSPSKKSRNSAESGRKREKEAKAQQKAAEDLERAREKERQKAAKLQEEHRKAEEAEAARREKQIQKELPAVPTERPSSAESDQAMAPPPPPKTILPAAKLRAPGRPAKPTREQSQTSRPAQVAIFVGSQRLGSQPSSTYVAKSQHESSASTVPAKQAITRPGSAQGSVRGGNPTNNAKKALDAAARKKEADEKAAQKKLEQKRELERKRAAKADEERRVEEQRRAAEQQRSQEAKLVAQKQAERQAAEARRREQQRLEQQRQQEEAQKARAAHDLAEAIKRERAQQQPRGDVAGTMLQLANKATVPDHAGGQVRLVQSNAAKPIKRVFQPEDDDDELQQHQPQQSQRPGLPRAPTSYQQNDAKRRRTDEEQDPTERHSVLAPPKRASNMRKVGMEVYEREGRADCPQESTLAKFPHGYTHAPPAATHHAPSMFKSTVNAQHQLQHGPRPGVPTRPSQTVQVSNARIPFAENNNPPGPAQHHPQSHWHPGTENIQPGAAPNKFKTPGRPAQAPKSAKSSPLYPNGDTIQLPEIATDSEDEDSDSDADNTGFRAPSWVASPALRDLLTQQQLVDPETVFGPIGELKMDEVFRNGKNQDRLKKFRDRGSSAAWVESGDAVTSAEKRRDMEMRERVVREGGWRYEPV